MPSERAQFAVDIKCSYCGPTGAMIWEEDDGLTPGPKGKRVLVEVAGGFHSEQGRTAFGDPVIVCSACDAIQND